MMCLVCPAAFFPDQIFAAFVRCFASLLYTYRKYMVAAPRGDKSGKLFQFNKDAFMRSLPHDAVEYTATLVETQGMSPLCTCPRPLCSSPTQLSTNLLPSVRRSDMTTPLCDSSMRSSCQREIAGAAQCSQSRVCLLTRFSYLPLMMVQM